MVNIYIHVVSLDVVVDLEITLCVCVRVAGTSPVHA